MNKFKFRLVYRHPSLPQDSFRLDSDVEASVDVADEPDGHAGVTAGFVGDFRPQDSDRDIDLFEHILGDFQTFQFHSEEWKGRPFSLSPLGWNMWMMWPPMSQSQWVIVPSSSVAFSRHTVPSIMVLIVMIWIMFFL